MPIATLNNAGQPAEYANTNDLLKALRSNTRFKAAQANHGAVNDDHAKQFAELLKQDDSLRTLNLWKNDISDIGAIAIADALKTHPTLTTLIIGFCPITDKGGIAFYNALDVNTHILELDLSDCFVSEGVLERIQSLLQRNRQNNPAKAAELGLRITATAPSPRP